ncbi:hypothetical protein [Flavisolibacter nicotianae]|uniref:hypothetical protein n=1 Tax=Flavisolibacter nicotianae TaxID=2364882 RepID=UPI000EAC62A7|nr:hypothetical protein [Flavisolibacter nicotianae]
MKYLLAACFSFPVLFLFAQTDSVRKIEPDKESSFDNYELLVIAIVGFLLLMGLRFWFKRTRKH